MRKLVIITAFGALGWLAACSVNTTDNDSLAVNERLEALEKELAELKETLGPGLAELMNQNYGHLQKLEAAIGEGNWEYADFCMHEMEETFEKIESIHNNHDELVQPFSVQFQVFIAPAFESLEAAVDAQNETEAAALFINLKTNCGTCHTANNHGFIAL